MNTKLVEKCNDPLYFESIKYAVHSLDDPTFSNTIVALLYINPYLATLCYVTSEYNEDLEHQIINHLSVVSVSDLHNKILYCLSYALLGEMDKFLGEIRWLVSPKRKNKNLTDLELLHPYYSNLLFESLLNNGQMEIFINYIRPLRNVYLSGKNQIDLICTLISRNQWFQLFYVLEAFSLYDFFRDDYLNVLPTAFRFLYNWEYKIAREVDKIVQAGRKLITIYILQNNELVESRYYEIEGITNYKPGKKYTKVKPFEIMMDEFFIKYTLRNIRSVYDVPDGYLWDQKKNGIDKPYKAYFDDDTLAWWVAEKGRIKFQGSLKGMGVLHRDICNGVRKTSLSENEDIATQVSKLGQEGRGIASSCPENEPKKITTIDGKTYTVSQEKTEYIVIIINKAGNVARIIQSEENGNKKIKFINGTILKVNLDAYQKKGLMEYIIKPENFEISLKDNSGGKKGRGSYGGKAYERIIIGPYGRIVKGPYGRMVEKRDS